MITLIIKASSNLSQQEVLCLHLCLFNVFPQAHDFILGSLTDAGFVWILPSYYSPHWWLLSNDSSEQCSNAVMREILESVVFVGPLSHQLMGNTSPSLPSSEVSYSLEV